MKYDVKYGGEYVGDIKEFTKFDMTIASKFVEKDMKKKAGDMSNEELETALRQLQLMFIERLPQNYSMFEILIGEVLVRKKIKCKVFRKEKWEEISWDFRNIEYLEKNKESVGRMNPGILYKPVDPQFPLIDYVFIEMQNEKKKICCIQVTFTKDHAKTYKTHQRAWKRLGLKDKDEIEIYVMCRPQFAKKYAGYKNKQFIKGSDREFEGVNYVAIKMIFDNPINYRDVTEAEI